MSENAHGIAVFHVLPTLCAISVQKWLNIHVILELYTHYSNNYLICCSI